MRYIVGVSFHRSWFKGADTTAVCYFLEDFFGKYIPTLSNPDPYLDSIWQALKGANKFLSVLYRSGLFLDRGACSQAAQAGLDFLRAYGEAAQLAFNQGKTRCKLNRKYHAFIHIVDRLCVAYEGSCRWSFNPLGESTQMDEDFVGKLASLSCAASTRAVHLQTMSRYMTNAWMHLRGMI